MEFADDQSSTSSSSSSYDIARTNPNTPSPKGDQPTSTVSSHKKRSGRKKFKETRHPVYRGVRQKNGSRWVCEVREPKNKKLRIWLGTFPTPEMAARAHDVAALALRGDAAVLNFPDSAWRLPRAQSSSAVDIQRAAFQAAKAFKPRLSNANPSSSSSDVNLLHGANSEKQVSEVLQPSSLADPSIVNNKENIQECPPCVDGIEKASDDTTLTFLDEEAIFNMPGLVDSMAEGMLLTPPAMKRGFNWDDVPHDIDLTLWME